MEIDKIALIHIEQRRVLFTSTKEGNFYYSPGGKREYGETDEQTLIREIKEELDVNIDPATIMYYATFRAPAHNKPAGTTVKITCYTAKFHGTPKASSEIGQLVWLSYADRDLTPEAGKMILDDLKAKNFID